MNFTANALLSLGASPVMAHASEEVEEMAALAGALVINIGTLSTPWVDSMFLAARAAQERSIPIVLDPVGAGATRFRTETARRLLDEIQITVVRGNASEILALAGETTATRGVDSVHSAETARAVASELAEKQNTVIAVTGVEDFVTDGIRSYTISNGHLLMGRVTGTGCAASAITGAFCAVEPDALMAVTGALVTFGLAGERAARSNPRPGTFQTLLLDALDEMDGALLHEGARIRIS
jgi:hydroxyethylthiazole kinase